MQTEDVHPSTGQQGLVDQGYNFTKLRGRGGGSQTLQGKIRTQLGNKGAQNPCAGHAYYLDAASMLGKRNCLKEPYKGLGH